MINTINIYKYEDSGENNFRYVLGKNGNNTLFIIAMNPSVATQELWDQTILKSFGLSAILGYDSCIVFNLLPYRASKSELLPSSFNADFGENVFKKNLREIFAVIKNYPKDSVDILACWGSLVISNQLLKNSLLRIYRGLCWSPKQINWFCLKDTKSGNDLTEDGHPRHLSFLKETTISVAFEIKNYIRHITSVSSGKL